MIYQHIQMLLLQKLIGFRGFDKKIKKYLKNSYQEICKVKIVYKEEKEEEKF